MDGRDRAPSAEIGSRGDNEEVGERGDQTGGSYRPGEVLPPEGPRPFLPKRWIVERTFSWLGQNRRMSKDYERLPQTGEAFIYAAMSRLMVRRLARS
jgi:Transposase DDE domain